MEQLPTLMTRSAQYRLWYLLLHYNRVMAPWTVSGTTQVSRYQKGKTRSPAVARDGRPYWPSRKTVIPSGFGLAAVLGVGKLSWLVKL